MRETTLLGLTPDWWMAGSTVVLTIATIGLGFFTALLWKATNRAVKDTAASIQIASDTAAAAQKQAEVAERVGMIQNINALHGHLRYLASCALFNSRPSDAALDKVAGSEKGFGRLLHRFEWQAAGDIQIKSIDSVLKATDLYEVDWEQLIPSAHLDDFFDSAGAIVDLATTAKVLFLVDQRVIDTLKYRHLLPLWREEIAHLHRQQTTPLLR